MDLSASYHVTNHIQNLYVTLDYGGLDKVIIGDGSDLHITHVGISNISSSSNIVHLCNVFCVPTTKSILISVGQFSKLTVCVELFP